MRRKRDLNASDVKILKELEERIDATIKKEFSDSGAFCKFPVLLYLVSNFKSGRLCGRSPKDAEPLDSTDVILRFERLPNNHENPKEIVLAMRRNSKGWLKRSMLTWMAIQSCGLSQGPSGLW